MKEQIGLSKGFPLFQYLAMASANLNLICCGMHSGWTSPSLPQLLSSDSYIPTTSEEGAWIAVMYFIGTFSGSVMGGFLLDRIGRRGVILLSSGPFVASWLILAFAMSVAMLQTGRFVAGVGEGLVVGSISLYMAEICDPEIRGLLGTGMMVSWIIGVLIINTIGSFLSITATALIVSSVPVLLVITFWWMPESPYYLILKGKVEQARQGLKVFKGMDDVEKELGRLTKAVEEQTANAGKILDLFTVKSTRRALFVMMGLRMAQQCSGCTAIMFYAQIIFKQAGDIISPTTGSTIYFGAQLLVSLFCSALVDRAGRKPLMVISMIGSGIALLIKGCYFYVQTETAIDTTNFSLVPMVAIIIFVVAFSIGMQTIPMLMIGEIFPTNVKAFAISFADIFFAIVTACVSKFFQSTKDAFGLHVPFLVFTGCCILGTLFLIYIVPETKGKTLEQIQQELKGETVSKRELAASPA